MELLALGAPSAILVIGLLRTARRSAQQPSIFLLIAFAAGLVGMLTWANPLVNAVICVVSVVIMAVAAHQQRNKRKDTPNEDDPLWKDLVLDRDE